MHVRPQPTTAQSIRSVERPGTWSRATLRFPSDSGTGRPPSRCFPRLGLAGLLRLVLPDRDRSIPVVQIPVLVVVRVEFLAVQKHAQDRNAAPQQDVPDSAHLIPRSLPRPDAEDDP